MDIFYFGEWLSVIEKYFRLREKNAAFRWTASDFERGKKRAAERPDDEKFSLDFKSARAFFEFFITIIIFYKKWREGKSSYASNRATSVGPNQSDNNQRPSFELPEHKSGNWINF